MKIITTSLITITLLAANGLATASVLTAEREARTARIEAMNREVSVLRGSRSASIENKLRLARVQAEIRKEGRQLDRLRDRAAALQKRGL